ncbi:carbohydrate ABC transporter permease [Limimaricola pyoseonensis]|uniref:sn-glycerol-3-phosphate transport system permease protein UgpE n=1 Tax=Limimaricola pyoseonensis TaxID=521013 RepID=A0A1G7CCP1_9RHOB|nr:carbohydrate ABC transporter permease [Limimaricola pyoseonensis]SDE37003.1 carbohydrate ABC transporter membrane protein 2, CUT1 family [Limimaricola pyoseonensis]
MFARYLLLLVLTVIAVLMSAPSIMTVFTSLKPATELGDPAWFPPLAPTFEHYVRVWTEGGFGKYFGNTVLISAIDAVVMIFIASMAAYAMVFIDFPGKLLLKFVFLLGLMIPVTAIILPLYSTVRSFGLINSHLGVILADLALAVSVFVFMFTSYFVGIPKALHEAARIDGASEFQIYRRVVLPISAPVIVTTGLLEFMWSWNDLLLRLLLLPREDMRTLSVGLLNFQGTQTRDITALSAGTVIMAVPVVALFLIFQRHFVRGMTSGAVK